MATTTSTATAKPIRPTSTPFTIRPLGGEQRWLKLLVYGKHGVGKTSLAGSAADVPQMQKVLFISAEAGELALHDNPMIKDTSQLDIVPVNNFEAVKKVYEYLSAHKRLQAQQANDKMIGYEEMLKGLEEGSLKKPTIYNAVVIDSLTEVEAYCMYDLLGISGEFRIDRIENDIKNPEYAEYKKNNNMINLLVRAFRDLQMHVIILAGERYEQDELRRFHYTPYLTGQLKSQVQGYFDIVGYLQAGEKKPDVPAERRLFVQPDGKFDAKCRRASFEESYLSNPTMGSILQKMNYFE